MPRHRKLESFPSVYYKLFDAALREGQHVISGLRKRECTRLRSEAYAFRHALMQHLPEVGRQYQPIVITIVNRQPHANVLTLNPDEIPHTIIFTNSNYSELTRIVEDSLSHLPDITPSAPAGDSAEPEAMQLPDALASVLAAMRGESE